MPESRVKTCPSCGKQYTEHSAVSRKDNKTLVCPMCGFHEAIIDAFKNDEVLQRRLFDAIEKDLRKKKEMKEKENSLKNTSEIDEK